MRNKKFGGANGKGYYIALILCAAAIGISGYLYYTNTNKEQPQLGGQDTNVVATNPADEQDLPVVATQPQNPGTEATKPTVDIINKALQKYGPPVRIYLDDVIILTDVLARCASGLRDVERHTSNQWRLLCQTIHTLVKRTASPNQLAYADSIYKEIKPYMLGMKAMCDWED